MSKAYKDQRISLLDVILALLLATSTYLMYKSFEFTNRSLDLVEAPVSKLYSKVSENGR